MIIVSVPSHFGTDLLGFKPVQAAGLDQNLSAVSISTASNASMH